VLNGILGKAWLLLLIFGLLAFYGGRSILSGVRQFRLARKYKDELISWAEPPGVSFKYDLPSWLAINIHRFALVVIGLIMLPTMLSLPADRVSLPGLSGSPALLSAPLLYAALSLAGFAWGYSLFGPIAAAIGGDHHYAISPEGILLSNQLLPWSAFAHYQTDADGKVIYLSSDFMPGAMGFVLAPPDAADVLKLTAILQAHLSASDVSAGVFTRYAFPAVMLLACTPFVVVACLLYLAPSGIGLIVDTFLMWVLLWLGGLLIMRLVYGGRARPATMA
jgi:hypothetical protein